MVSALADWDDVVYLGCSCSAVLASVCVSVEYVLADALPAWWVFGVAFAVVPAG